MTELECEIKRLEDELERMFTEYSKRYKGIKLRDKSIFEVEMVKVELEAISEMGKASVWKIAFVAAIATIILQLIYNSALPGLNLFGMLVINITLLTSWLLIIRFYSNTRREDTKGLELINMLLERKKKLEYGE